MPRESHLSFYQSYIWKKTSIILLRVISAKWHIFWHIIRHICWHVMFTLSICSTIRYQSDITLKIPWFLNHFAHSNISQAIKKNCVPLISNPYVPKKNHWGGPMGPCDPGLEGAARQLARQSFDFGWGFHGKMMGIFDEEPGECITNHSSIYKNFIIMWFICIWVCLKTGYAAVCPIKKRNWWSTAGFLGYVQTNPYWFLVGVWDWTRIHLAFWGMDMSFFGFSSGLLRKYVFEMIWQT